MFKLCGLSTSFIKITVINTKRKLLHHLKLFSFSDTISFPTSTKQILQHSKLLSRKRISVMEEGWGGDGGGLGSVLFCKTHTTVSTLFLVPSIRRKDFDVHSSTCFCYKPEIRLWLATVK
jgi:hypothetical protein